LQGYLKFFFPTNIPEFGFLNHSLVNTEDIRKV